MLLLVKFGASQKEPLGWMVVGYVCVDVYACVGVCGAVNIIILSSWLLAMLLSHIHTVIFLV